MNTTKMFKSLESFGKRFKYVPVIKRNLTIKSNQKNNNERIFTIKSIDEFNEILLKSDSPVIVNFSATWCFNCTLVSPLIQTIVRENSRKIILLKVDVDKHLDLALEHNVSVIPALLGINQGQIQSTLVGLHEVEKIQSWVDVFLNKI